MTKAVRNLISYGFLAIGIGFIASPAITHDSDGNFPVEISPFEFWWPVAAGLICSQFSIRLAVNPRLNCTRAWLKEVVRNGLALFVLAASLTLSILFSDERQVLGDRVLFAAIIPAAAWICIGAWLWLIIRTERGPRTETAELTA
jgi:hypothetical protein